MKGGSRVSERSDRATGPWGRVPALVRAPLTGFFEEAAFRGYMQVQLEDRYRPAVAIFLTALAFAVVHFPAPGQLPLFVFGSLGWGVLTYLSRTIVPAIVMHGVVDGVMFLWVWKNPDAFRGMLEHNVLRTGISDLFVLWVTIAALGTVGTIVGFIMLAKTQRQRLDQEPA